MNGSEKTSPGSLATTNTDVRTATTSHTPGPWSVPHFAEPDTNCECKYVLCDHMMGAVAAVYCSGEGDDWKTHGDNPRFAEAVANARLITAAPDMLAVLQEIAPYWEGTDSQFGERVRAAIAKATGAAS